MLTRNKKTKDIRYIYPNDRFDEGFFKPFINIILETYKNKDLVFQLFKRDFFSKYRRSFIGSLWIIVTPVASIMTWLFLHKTNILNPGNTGISYPSYVLSGTFVWSLFTGTFKTSSGFLNSTSYIIKNISIPHELLFVEQLLVNLSNILISFLLTIFLLFFLGGFSKLGIILLPIAITPIVLIGISLGLITGLFSVISYDIKRIVALLLRLLMFVTPVIYSADAIHWNLVSQIVRLNPLSYMIKNSRDVLFTGRFETPLIFTIYLIVSILFFVISWRTFYVSEQRVIERLF